MQNEQKELSDRDIRNEIIIRNLRDMLLLSKDWHQIERFMLGQGMGKIAIYGMGILGQTFLNQMQDTKVEVCYGIDKRPKVSRIEVRRPEETGKDMDAIIVTAELDFQNIRKKMSEVVDVPIISLSNLLEEIMSLPISLV